MYEIEDGVPLLPKGGRKGSEEIYPWSKTKVGQSFFVPLTKTGPIAIASSARGHCKRHGGKFATRQCEKDGVPGTRVWRIE